MRFEWDSDKAALNRTKHRISFQEGETVFDDPLADTFRDPEHSFDEHRYLTFGTSVSGHALVVSHTIDIDRVRIISARTMTRRERKLYEEGIDY